MRRQIQVLTLDVTDFFLDEVAVSKEQFLQDAVIQRLANHPPVSEVVVRWERFERWGRLKQRAAGVVQDWLAELFWG